MHIDHFARAPQTGHHHLQDRFVSDDQATIDRLRDAWPRLYSNDWPGVVAQPLAEVHVAEVHPLPVSTAASRKLFLRRTTPIDALGIDLHPALKVFVAAGG